MGIRKKCLIITLLCFSSLMYASEFMFKHLEVKDGLSNNQVLDIFKDSEGFMWFATASGLNRYDGCQMTLFRSYNADPASLPDNYIKSIQEDYKGNLWILPVWVMPFTTRNQKHLIGRCMHGYVKSVLTELLH